MPGAYGVDIPKRLVLASQGDDEVACL